MASSASLTNTTQQGTEEQNKQLEENVLQKHAAFFDINHDGVVYPWETFKGLREIGCGIVISTLGALFINIGLSRKTRPGKSFSLIFPIEVKNIQLSKHGSDSGVYDSQGRFVPSKFEEIFTKHARTHPDALTYHELKAMLKANRQPKDIAGWVASFGEWNLLYALGKDEKGLLQKETIRGVYDGSLFEQLEKKKTSTDKKKK